MADKPKSAAQLKLAENREKAKLNLTAKLGKNPRAPNVMKLVGLRRRGNAAGEAAFLNSLTAPAAAAAAAAGVKKEVKGESGAVAAMNAAANGVVNAAVAAAAAPSVVNAVPLGAAAAKKSPSEAMKKYRAEYAAAKNNLTRRGRAPTTEVISRLIKLRREGKDNSAFLAQYDAKVAELAAKEGAKKVKKDTASAAAAPAGKAPEAKEAAKVLREAAKKNLANALGKGARAQNITKFTAMRAKNAGLSAANYLAAHKVTVKAPTRKAAPAPNSPGPRRASMSPKPSVTRRNNRHSPKVANNNGRNNVTRLRVRRPPMYVGKNWSNGSF